MSHPIKFRIIHHADQQTIDAMYTEYMPVFVLSTGRSGSKFLVTLLNTAANVLAFHEPSPTLQYFSNYAYHHQQEQDILTQMIQAARMETVLDAFIKNKIYVESNQCLTFFAPVIARLFQGSKFVHLIRHPGSFARSAIRKGWYSNDTIWESGRVRMEDRTAWEKLHQLEKIGWLWTETNAFIENFKKSVGTKRVWTARLEDLTGNTLEVVKLFQLIGAQPFPEEKIRALQAARVNELIIEPDEPPNLKKVPAFPEYADWGPAFRKKFRAFVEDLASFYGYKL